MNLSDRIGRRIKLHDLHVFMTVVEAGSMIRAAQRLNTVQPAISRSIGELESALGVRLLDRHRYGTALTDYGRLLLDCGAATFDNLHRGVKSIEILADPEAGQVRIGCSPLLAATYLSAVIDRVSRRHPRIAFNLVTGYNEMLHRELSEHKVDFLIIRRFGPPWRARLDFETLYDDPYVIAAGIRSPWSRRRVITLADLVSESWALPPTDSMVGSHLADVFRASGLEYPRVTLVARSLEVRFSLLATGRFLTMLPASALRLPVRRPGIKILPVELPMASVPIGIVNLKNRELGRTAELFITHAREVAKPLRKLNSSR